jgi:hypothetical protein
VPRLSPIPAEAPVVLIPKLYPEYSPFGEAPVLIFILDPPVGSITHVETENGNDGLREEEVPAST